jgi:tripartite-type tricarboxylate transporter receptor subunit TctC
VPTAREAGLKGYDVTIWFGVLAPSGTPAAVVGRLSGDIAAIMKTDEMKKRMRADGATARSSTPAEFAALIDSDLAKWAPVVKASGASLD